MILSAICKKTRTTSIFFKDLKSIAGASAICSFSEKNTSAYIFLIIYLQKFQHADWVRARQLIPNSVES